MQRFESQLGAGTSLISSLIAHAAEKTGRKRVMVLLDEAKRSDVVFDRVSSHVLQDLLLNKRILPDVRTALVMPSPTTNPTGERTGGRVIVFRNLDPNEIVSKIWQVPADRANDWLPLAASLCQLPRLAEQVKMALPKNVLVKPTTLEGAV